MSIAGNQDCCRDRLKHFTVDGLVMRRNTTRIHTYMYGWPVETYKDIIDINVPDSLRLKQFLGIKISIPDYYLTLCEVQVFLNLGKFISIISPGAEFKILRIALL